MVSQAVTGCPGREMKTHRSNSRQVTDQKISRCKRLDEKDFAVDDELSRE
jgi:hypothetical protein